MRYIVTGGSGFIGTNVIALLLSKNYDILNIDIREPQNKDHFNYWIDCNICNYDKLRKLILDYDPDYIIHLAARTDLVGETLNDYSANIDGVKNLMNISIELNELKKIVIASSMLVCELGYFPKNFNDYKPNTLYGESKVLTEKIVKKFKNSWTIVRPTSIWGPWFGEPYNNFFRLVLMGAYFNINEKEAANKTFGYVKNTSNQILDICNSKNKNVIHNYFYLGDKKPINITNWANEIRNLSGKKKLITINKSLFKAMCLFGDFIFKYLKIKTPLNSFRFKNMTTNNIIDLSKLNEFCSGNNYNDFRTNISETINWIKNTK